jgi:hypothetical protein
VINAPYHTTVDAQRVISKKEVRLIDTCKASVDGARVTKDARSAHSGCFKKQCTACMSAWEKAERRHQRLSGLMTRAWLARHQFGHKMHSMYWAPSSLYVNSA